MNSKLTRNFGIALFACLPAVTFAAETNPAHVKKVLLIGIDGCRVDCLTEKNSPTIAGLAASGTFAANAYAGGNLETPSQQATFSGPGWSTILTGVWTDKHHVKGNDFKGNDLAPGGHPHFFSLLKQEKPALKLASAVSWTEIDTFIVAPVRKDFAFTFAGDYKGDMHRPSDATVQKQLVDRLAKADDDLTFVHYGQCDGAGHKLGFSAKVPEYLVSLANVDAYIAADIATIKARKTYANEDWLVVITTDHGGKGKSHGSQAEECRHIFIIANGPGVAAKKIPGFIPQAAVAPTVAGWIGVTPKAAWGWETTSIIK